MTNEVYAFAMDLSFLFSGARLIFLRFGKVEQPVLRLILIIFSWGVYSSEKKTTLLRNRKSEESATRKKKRNSRFVVVAVVAVVSVGRLRRISLVFKVKSYRTGCLFSRKIIKDKVYQAFSCVKILHNLKHKRLSD